jgi:hypothetical protein
LLGPADALLALAAGGWWRATDRFVLVVCVCGQSKSRTALSAHVDHRQSRVVGIVVGTVLSRARLAAQQESRNDSDETASRTSRVFARIDEHTLSGKENICCERVRL